MPYDLQTARAPRLAGFLLRLVTALLDNRFTKWLLVGRILSESGVATFRRASLLESPSVTPALPYPGQPDPPAAAFDPEPFLTAPATPGFHFESAADFARAYRERRRTPLQVAERVIAAIQQTDAGSPPLRAFIASDADDIRRQAAASTERHQRGAPLGPLDGVPVAIKDELDLLPYATTVGTRFLRDKAATDSTIAARLRGAGAVLIGKANMHEIGIDTTGYNAHHGTTRNPYGPGRYTGGSSSGCGTAVAAGLCPIAIGADGGGSIRIPAALCGVVGLKATWSRISEAGAAPLCWSVGHAGPLGATVADVALAYALIAGPDPRDPNTLRQPAPRFDFRCDLAKTRIGVYAPWFDDADADIVRACRAMVDQLRQRGATVVEVEIPDLELSRVAHAVTILSEMATGVDPWDAKHRRDYGTGVRFNLALARELTNRDYVRAQQARTRLSGHLARVFAGVDFLLTPTTAITAPVIRPDALASGDSDLARTMSMIRFVAPFNMTGHPALSLTAGYDASGMPIGLQIVGRPWEEDRVIGLGMSVESLVERRAPGIHVRLLEGELSPLPDPRRPAVRRSAPDGGFPVQAS